MSRQIYWDRDRLRVHDGAGGEPDRDLPLADVLAWLGAGGVIISGNAALTNARTPSAHKASHATGQADAIAPSEIGAAATNHDHTGTYVLRTSAGVMADVSAITDEAAKAAIVALANTLIAAGILTMYTAPSSSSGSSG